MESGGIEDLSFLMFREVLSMVMLYFFLCSNSSANAKNGIMWPWAMKGNNTASCFPSVSAIACQCQTLPQLVSPLLGFFHTLTLLHLHTPHV